MCFAGSLLVFIPAAGDFINAEYLGSTQTTMIGNVIQQQFLVVKDYPAAAALSMVLMLIILVGVLAVHPGARNRGPGMTTQAGAAVANAADQADKAPKTVKGSPKWGDVLLRVVAGLVLLYLFLPIFVIILFSFNNPKGKFNYAWQGFTLKNWLDPFKYPALTDALKLSINVAAVSTAYRACSRHVGGHSACPATVPGQSRPSTPSLCCR